MRWFALLILSLGALGYASDANACSCMKLTPSEGLTSSSAVFTGKVTNIEENTATKFGGLEVTLRVKEMWKGEPKEEVKVHTAASSAACGYSFAKGETYLVYAVRDEADPMRVSLCSRTAPVGDAKEDLDFLGKPAHKFNDASRRKSKHGEANLQDNCSAAPGALNETRAVWLALLLAGIVLGVRRLTRG